MVVHTFATTQLQLQSAQYCAEALERATRSHSHVLLLLSGGSAVPMYAQMLLHLDSALDLQGLQVALVDERYLPYGHQDTNEQQLRLAGVIEEFEQRGAIYTGMVTSQTDPANQATKPETVALLATRAYQALFHQADYVLLFAGLGPDGHTAGWLPTASEEVFTQRYDRPEAVVYYQLPTEDTSNLFRQRLTLSTQLVPQIDAVVVYSGGQPKRQALHAFANKTAELHSCPALVLHNIPKVALLTDVKVETLDTRQ